VVPTVIIIGVKSLVKELNNTEKAELMEKQLQFSCTEHWLYENVVQKFKIIKCD